MRLGHRSNAAAPIVEVFPQARAHSGIEIDTNIPAAAAQPKPAKCARTEKRRRSQALADLKFRISELQENAKFFLNFTKTEFLPVDETATELTDLLFSYETVVISRALKDVDDYLTKYCPFSDQKD